MAKHPIATRLAIIAMMVATRGRAQEPYTAADVEGEPRPGEETGRIDDVDDESAWRELTTVRRDHSHRMYVHIARDRAAARIVGVWRK
jgi:hypothetical protein